MKEQDPTFFSKGDRIPAGKYFLYVRYVEMRDVSTIRGSSELFAAGDLGVIVYFTISGSAPLDRNVLGIYTGTGALLWFTLRDSDDKTYRAGTVLPEHHFRMMQLNEADMWRDMRDMMSSAKSYEYALQAGTLDMVALFAVPFESSGFTLYVKNPDPLEGQPRLAAVSLGR